MPTTVTPPEILRPSHIDEGDIHDAGGGGKRPPVDKRTGGNGDDDDWSAHPAGRRGPRELISQYRSGMFFALAADFLFFIGIVAAFLVTKHSYHVDAYGRYINNWLPIELPPILFLNTAVILLSSVSAEVARRAMFHERDLMEEWIGLSRRTSRRAGLWLGVTLALGVTFLLGQWTAWLQLSIRRGSWDMQSSKFFYVFTAVHAVHLLLGVAALMTALLGLARSRRLLVRQILVDTTVWYWHAMGLLWILLFVLLEYFQ